MKYLILILALLIPVTSYADCVSDCKKIIDVAKQTIADRDQLISDQDKTIKDLGVSLETIAKDRDSDREALEKFYHNPFIMLGVGLILGGTGILLLEHK